MPRSAPVVLLVVLAVLGTAFVGAAQTTGPDPGMTPADAPAVLPVGQNPTTGYETVGVSLATSLASQHDRASVRLDRYATIIGMNATDSPKKRAELYRATLDRIAVRVGTLEDRHRAARRALANGSIEPGTAATRLGSIAVRATENRETLLALLDNIRATDTNGADGEFRNRSEALLAELDRLTGPATHRLGAAVQGTEPPRHVYIAATADGLVLSTVSNGTYYREAVRADNRDNRTVGLNLTAGWDRLPDLYPGTWNASASGTRLLERSGSDAYHGILEYPGGRLSTYIDASSGDVFREVQALNLSRYPDTEAAVRQQDGLVLRANRTYAGGPLRVSLRTAEGNPADGRVTVEGTFVGRTGSDGILWTVSPGGRGDDTVILTVERGASQLPLSYRLTGEG